MNNFLIESLVCNMSSLNINDIYINKAVVIQKWYRGCILRYKQLPLIMYNIKKTLLKNPISFSNQNSDGRINSCFDEDKIIDFLIIKFNKRINKPKIRMWYDFTAYDYKYGWIPINIKTTTTLTCDNTGNFAMCVYAYTNYNLKLNESYENGEMSKILINHFNNKKYNNKLKKDYYFLVLNKTDSQDIIINSVKGLDILTPNINNLPFQICWNKNKIFKPKQIKLCVNQFINCLQKPKPSWREIFLRDIRKIEL